MLRTIFLAVTAVVATAALAGCSDDQPDTSPPPTGTTTAASTPSTPTEDPGPVEPTLPAAAKKDGKAGAIAFVTYYWAVVDYAQATGDTQLLARLQTADCTRCTRGRKWIDAIKRAGGQIRGGHNTVVAIEAAENPDQEDLWLVRATVRTTRARVIDASKLNATYASSDAVLEFSLRFDSSWSITRWGDA